MKPIIVNGLFQPFHVPFTRSWPGEQPRADPRVDGVNGVFGAVFSEGVECCGSSEDFHSFSIWNIRSFLEKKTLRMINMIIWRFESAELLEHWKSDTESFRFISMVQPMFVLVETSYIYDVFQETVEMNHCKPRPGSAFFASCDSSP